MMNRVILRLALPNILANLTVPLIGLTDIFLIGNYGHVDELAAMAVGITVFNLLYWNWNFLRMSTGGFTAQAHGRGDSNEMVYILARALLIAWVISAPLIVFRTNLTEWSFDFLSLDSEVKDFALSYVNIRIWALPAGLSIFALQGWFIGRQNTVIPMAMSIATQILNICFALFFILHLNSGIEGLAYAAIIAQYVSLFGYVIFVFMFRSPFKGIVWDFKILFSLREFLKVFSVNSHLFIRTLVNTFVFTFYKLNDRVAGDAVLLGVNEILLQFLLFFSFFIDGFANAAEALCGRFFGAKDKVSFIRAVRYSFYWGLGFALFFAFIFAIWSSEIISLLTDEPIVQQRASLYKWWATVFPLVSFACFIWDGVYIGVTAGREMRDTNIISAILFFSLFYILPQEWGNHVILFTLSSYFLMRGFVQSVMYRGRILPRLARID